MNAVNMLNWAPRVGFDVWGLRIFSLDLFSNKINVRHVKFRSQIIVTEFVLLVVLVDLSHLKIRTISYVFCKWG